MSATLGGFQSVLFRDPATIDVAAGQPPECFSDLRLDEIVSSIIAGREEYELRPYFHIPLRSVTDIQYRHAVFRDLEDPRLSGCVRAFAERMRGMRAALGQGEKLHHQRQQERWFLDAVRLYCAAVTAFAAQLARAEPKAHAFLDLRDYLAEYLRGARFTTLQADTDATEDALAAVRYELHIEGTRIHVSRYGGEPDYAEQVLETFDKFSQGTTREYRFAVPSTPDMNHVEAAVLDRVALLHPQTFERLRRYCSDHRDYVDPVIRRLDREAQFYLAVLDYNAQLHSHGLPFCYPEVLDRSREVYARDAFDVALAARLLAERAPVVCNDFRFEEPERVAVVSGPNQGGKSTFARMFGQMHWFGGLGCPVAGRAARLFLFDRLLTLFEREEHLENLSGKLEDELLRLHMLLGQATSDTILILNETFGSTTLSDALSLGRGILEQVIERGMLCVYVTFLEELASLNRSTMSMVSTVDPEDPARRTFKVIRRRADGLAYAMAVARKHRLTYDSIRQRIDS